MWDNQNFERRTRLSWLLLYEVVVSIGPGLPYYFEDPNIFYFTTLFYQCRRNYKDSQDQTSKRTCITDLLCYTYVFKFSYVETFGVGVKTKNLWENIQSYGSQSSSSHRKCKKTISRKIWINFEIIFKIKGISQWDFKFHRNFYSWDLWTSSL